MRKLALVLLAVGILTLLYPPANRAYFWHWQQKALENWEMEVQQAEPPERPGEVQQPDPEDRQPAEAATRGPEPLAILEIEKIDLVIPVYRGATRANLRIGAGLVEEGAPVGAEGNIVITAHRSHNYGMQFNRLDELAVGDELVLKSRSDTYRYIVVGTEVVQPDNLEVLQGRAGEKWITLITCHPLYSPDPPYRLVVQGRLKQS